MITKRQFVDSCLHEIAVIKHLAGKVPPGQLDWRPTPKQRSIVELLQYLTTCALVPARAMVTGSWAHAEAMEGASSRVAPDIFSQAMDVQGQALVDLMDEVSDEELLHRDATLPWGTSCKLGQALIDTALKTLVAYRMQLFLYAKQSGAHQLGPANCWVGVDPRAQTATA